MNIYSYMYANFESDFLDQSTWITQTWLLYSEHLIPKELFIIKQYLIPEFFLKFDIIEFSELNIR